MKKITAMLLSLVLITGAFAGCAPSEPEPTATPEPELTAAERAELYKTAIENARGEEENTNMPVATDPEAEEMSMLLEMLGITAEDTDGFALSVSMMNVRAYGIAVIKPAEGSEEAVKTGLENFITTQQQNFEFYLADQYEIAKAAKLETLEDGTVVMVMCENADEVYTSITDAITAK
ncbi:MAG: DUF4358 domain-containing protein [Candidatus Heteroscillospira sp.]|jgi:hypothetical protein